MRVEVSGPGFWVWGVRVERTHQRRRWRSREGPQARARSCTVVLRMSIWDLGLRVWNFGVGVTGSGVGIWGVGSRVQDLGFRIYGSGFGFRVEGWSLGSGVGVQG